MNLDINIAFALMDSPTPPPFSKTLSFTWPLVIYSKDLKSNPGYDLGFI
jgi:hypothetical protein